MMLYGLVLTLHILVSLFLIVVILLQGGRGGMGEALGGAAVQSLFGGGANTVMTKLTAVVAGLFVVTCLSLAALSTARGRSVIDQLPSPETQLPLSPDQLPFAPPKAPDSAPQATAPSQPASPSDNTPAPAATPPAAEPAPASSENPVDQEGASGAR